MTLEKELLDKGYQKHGPVTLEEVKDALSYLDHNHIGIKEFRIIRGPYTSEDLKDYPNTWMIYYNIRDKRSDLEGPTLIGNEYPEDT